MKRPNLSKRLQLEFPIRLPDGSGGFVEIWAHVANIWAAVELRGSGRETDVASRLALKVTTRNAPWGSLLRPTTQMRFKDGERLYRIEAVHEMDPTNRFLTCFASEEIGI